MTNPHVWPQTLKDLISKVEWKIHNHALDAKPREAVGLVYPDGTIRRLINEAAGNREFRVTSDQMRRAFDRRPDLNPVGLYHTHPTKEAAPSRSDRQFMAEAAEKGRPLFFIHGTDGLRAWVWEDGAAKEVGR